MAVGQTVTVDKGGKDSSSAAGKAAAPVQDALQDTETPKGTLTILLLYAVGIVGLWGFMYLSLLLRR